MTHIDTVNWLDIMPSIPLANAVPVTQRIGEGIATGVVVGDADLKGAMRIAWSGHFGEVHGTVKGCRVNLDDPQGFAYALRYLFSLGAGSVWDRHNDRPRFLGHASDDAVRYTFSLISGQEVITDADRLALARAFDEVKS